MNDSKILLFDGDCLFCNQAVRFIIKRDHESTFKFASLQSEIGQQLQRKHAISPDVNSFIFIDENKYYTKSTAVLRMSRHLDGFWKALCLLLIIPRPIRNACYNFIAKHRYQWFGHKQSCEIPPPHIRDRFISFNK